MYLNDNGLRVRGPSLIFKQARSMGLIQRFNPIPDYHNHLRKLIDFGDIAENPQQIVVDSMYGSGRGVIRTLLQGTLRSLRAAQ